MKIYEWGFDKAGFAGPAGLLSFLDANNFIEVSHGYRGTGHYTITYANPGGVIFVTLLRGYQTGNDPHAAVDGYLGYVGITGFNKGAFEKVIFELRRRHFAYEDESPNKRDFI